MHSLFAVALASVGPTGVHSYSNYLRGIEGITQMAFRHVSINTLVPSDFF